MQSAKVRRANGGNIAVVSLHFPPKNLNSRKSPKLSKLGSLLNECCDNARRAAETCLRGIGYLNDIQQHRNHVLRIKIALSKIIKIYCA